MNGDAENFEELTRLVSAMLDDRITPDEMAKLEALLQRDAGARRTYMQLVDQEIGLSCLVGTAAAKARRNVLPFPGAQARERMVPLRRNLLAMAAVIVLLAVVGFALLTSPGSRRKPTARPAEPRNALSHARASGTWSEDFEAGVAAGWTGMLVPNGLPSGSRFGIAPERMEFPGSVAYGIKLPENWGEGLALVTQRSTLHLNYLLRTRNGLNVFLHTVSDDADGKRYEMYQATITKAFATERQRWESVSIPFAQFARKVRVEPLGNLEFRGPPPEPGERVATVVFSSPEPLDLIIDRAWITPDGPEQETVTPLTPGQQ